jgi:RimJ/RimL family protein N-acetyltransferase
MNVVVTHDFARFDETVFPFLAQDPVRNTVLLTVVDMLRVGGSADNAPPWFAWVHDSDERVVGAVLRTPPYPVALSGMTEEAARTLGAALAGHELPGAFGDIATVTAFASAAGRRHRVRINEVQHVLTTLTPPPPTPGAARPYRDSDADAYVEWDRKFADEAGVRRSADPIGSLATRRRSGGGLWLWQVDGETVSICGRSGPVCGVPRIGPVWTPPEHRGRGYAAAVTAFVCADALAAGARACTLFADAANPTSNGVYQRIGFRPVAETVEAEFT